MSYSLLTLSCSNYLNDTKIFFGANSYFYENNIKVASKQKSVSTIEYFNSYCIFDIFV